MRTPLDRRHVLCGGGAIAFSAIMTSLLGTSKPVYAETIAGSVPEVDRVSIRVVVDSYQFAVAASKKVGRSISSTLAGASPATSRRPDVDQRVRPVDARRVAARQRDAEPPDRLRLHARSAQSTISICSASTRVSSTRWCSATATTIISAGSSGSCSRHKGTLKAQAPVLCRRRGVLLLTRMDRPAGRRATSARSTGRRWRRPMLP